MLVDISELLDRALQIGPTPDEAPNPALSERQRKRQKAPDPRACETDVQGHQSPTMSEEDAGGSTTQSNSKRKRKSKRKPANPEKRKEDNRKSRVKKRRANDANSPFGGHINPPSKTRIAATKIVHTDADASKLPFCQGAFRGKHFPREPRDVWTLERLQREDYHVVEWDGRCVSIAVRQASHQLTIHHVQVRTSSR